MIDAGMGGYGTSSVVVSSPLTGPVTISPPPNVFTPNGDGINDVWQVRGPNNGFGPLNAYSYTLIINNRWGGQVYSSSGTKTSGTTGYVGGEIQWNGSGVSNGTYFWYLTLTNCSGTSSYNGFVDKIGGTNRVSNSSDKEGVFIYPNPADESITISTQNLNPIRTNQELQTAAGQEYSINLVDATHRLKSKGVTEKGKLTFDTRAIPEGTYFLHIVNDKEVIKEQVIIKH